jgi:hypothetical protein
MLKELAEDRVVPSESIRGDELKTWEDQDEPESEEEQWTSILFTLEQLEVHLKMNRPNFNELVMAFKGGSSKNVGYQLTKLDVATPLWGFIAHLHH